MDSYLTIMIACTTFIASVLSAIQLYGMKLKPDYKLVFFFIGSLTAMASSKYMEIGQQPKIERKIVVKAFLPLVFLATLSEFGKNAKQEFLVYALFGMGYLAAKAMVHYIYLDGSDIDFSDEEFYILLGMQILQVVGFMFMFILRRRNKVKTYWTKLKSWAKKKKDSGSQRNKRKRSRRQSGLGVPDAATAGQKRPSYSHPSNRYGAYSAGLCPKGFLGLGGWKPCTNYIVKKVYSDRVAQCRKHGWSGIKLIGKKGPSLTPQCGHTFLCTAKGCPMLK